MFVQSARFVKEHKRNPGAELSIHGQERVDGNVRLARMNLAVHGLEGDIKHGNTYYEDLHSTVGRFDFVCANPPFNVSQVDKERLSAEVGPGRRYPFGLPRTDNANYLWIQDFYSALNDTGRAGFVMANSASDARASEQDIRQKLIQAHAVDVMVAVGPNMFYTVTLPCTLWFFDRSKAREGSADTPVRSENKGGAAAKNPEAEKSLRAPLNRADTVLFIDARHIYRQIDRAHRDWTDAQISFMANIVRLYRGESPDFTLGGEEAKAKLEELFGSDAGTPARNAQGSVDTPVRSSPKPAGRSAHITCAYRDIPGLCRAATLTEIEAQGWSFKTQLGTWNEELETLNAQARELEQTIAQNVAEILEA
jgi:type I restriction enzyme M protein